MVRGFRYIDCFELQNCRIMLDSIIVMLQGLPWEGVVLMTFLVAFAENIVPPLPSDIALVFIGTLVGLGTVSFYPVVVSATAGSTAGFMAAYWLGRRYGASIVGWRWMPFLTDSLLEKVRMWFDRFQVKIIIANRFLAGTRAVISFAAGMYQLPLLRTTMYSALSAFAWNCILVGVGMAVGNNWPVVERYLTTYGWITTTALVLAATTYWLWKKRKNPNT
jgi:membrane protein DedA with SNARE-associated domain